MSDELSRGFQRSQGIITLALLCGVVLLCLAFTGATGLSPTDTYPLSRSAKALMMVEAIISMLIIVILAGRAVNIL